MGSHNEKENFHTSTPSPVDPKPHYMSYWLITEMTPYIYIIAYYTCDHGQVVEDSGRYNHIVIELVSYKTILFINLVVLSSTKEPKYKFHCL